MKTLFSFLLLMLMMAIGLTAYATQKLKFTNAGKTEITVQATRASPPGLTALTAFRFINDDAREFRAGVHISDRAGLFAGSSRDIYKRPVGAIGEPEIVKRL